MKVFRLSREKHATPLSGKGAAKYGARWNPEKT
jgi:RES domain-containing protein